MNPNVKKKKQQQNVRCNFLKLVTSEWNENYWMQVSVAHNLKIVNETSKLNIENNEN